MNSPKGYLLLALPLLVLLVSFTSKPSKKAITLDGIVRDNTLIVYKRPSISDKKVDILVKQVIKHNESTTSALVSYESNPTQTVLINGLTKDISKNKGADVGEIYTIPLDKLPNNSLREGQYLSWNGCNAKCQEDIPSSILYSISGIKEDNSYESIFEEQEKRLSYRVNYEIRKSELMSSNKETKCLEYKGGGFRHNGSNINLENHDGSNLERNKFYQVEFNSRQSSISFINENKSLCKENENRSVDETSKLIFSFLVIGIVLYGLWNSRIFFR
jgi:hypothetical protein